MAITTQQINQAIAQKNMDDLWNYIHLWENNPRDHEEYNEVLLYQLYAYYYFTNKEYAQAQVYAEKTCDLAPDNGALWDNKGKILMMQEQYYLALLDFIKAVKLQNHESLTLMLRMASKISQWFLIKDMLPYYVKNKSIIPDNEETQGLFAMGLSYYDFTMAEAYYEEICQRYPRSVYLLNNYVLLLRDNHHAEKALEYYKILDQIVPNEPIITVNKGYCYLTIGDYKKGLACHEKRFDTGIVQRIITYDTQPKHAREWEGVHDNLFNEDLLIYAEQGFGEGLMFSRFIQYFLRMERHQAPRSITLLCQLGLERLFCYNFGKFGIQILPAHEQMEDTGILYQYTRHVPLMSLPYKIGIEQPIGVEGGYLSVNPEWVEDFKMLVPPSSRYKIGIIWQGNPRLHDEQASAMNIRRSCPLAYLDTLINHQNFDIYSLQVGQTQEEIAPYIQQQKIIDLGGYCGDFADCGSLMTLMDYIITVDTGTCHLAGALDKPTLLLNRYDSCWRWGYHGSKTAWYPSMTIFRQHKAFDWKSVMHDLIEFLTSLPPKQTLS